MVHPECSTVSGCAEGRKCTSGGRAYKQYCNKIITKAGLVEIVMMGNPADEKSETNTLPGTLYERCAQACKAHGTCNAFSMDQRLNEKTAVCALHADPEGMTSKYEYDKASAFYRIS